MINWAFSLFKKPDGQKGAAPEIDSPIVRSGGTKYRIVHPDRHTCRLEYEMDGNWFTIPPDHVAHLNYIWIPGQETLFTIHSYNEERELKHFAAKWPCIEEYFGHMRELQKRWNEKMDKVDRSIKYL
jgi:hypothetical protein